MITGARFRNQLLDPKSLLLTLLLTMLLSLAPGCATITGVITGAPMGLVDAPAQVYRHNKASIDEHPEYWSVNILIIAPLGFALGPVMGLVKGIGADMRSFTDQTDYGEVFGTYQDESIWRPWTIPGHDQEDGEPGGGGE